ncbi:MAG: aldo/keto reductase [Gemmatales bacterium]
MSTNWGILGELNMPLALGVLRLCTADRPDWDQAISLLHKAFDAGIRILDTADTYCIDNKDLHFGERLIQHALSIWKGPAKEVKVLTKAGMTRPQGRWIPDGRPEQLRKAVEGSLQALGVDSLFVLQLHVHDSRVPFEDTLGALAELQRAGKVEHLGLCNTTTAEIQQAQRHFPVAVVQNELSLGVRKSAGDGTLQFTAQQGIPFLAYRPLGGIAKVEKLATNKLLQPLARRHFATTTEVALAAVRSAGSHVIPIIGATRLASLQSSIRAMGIKLDASDRTALDVKYSFAAKESPSTVAIPSSSPSDSSGEIVLLMGIQGAGKSELVAGYVERGYVRLNRDMLGGKLDDLIPRMHALIQSGQRQIVLDNTYPTRLSRAPVIAAGRAHGLPVICRWLNTSMTDARINVVLRMIGRYGRPLGPDEMKAYAKTDPNLPPPAALKRYAESFEEPQLDEGFAHVEAVQFVRRRDENHKQKALFLDVDGTLRKTKSGEIYPRHADDVVLLPHRQAVLQWYVDQGYRLFFVSNQSGIASGKVTQSAAESAFVRTAELLKLPVTEIAYCPHPAFPVGCYCRKPGPGMGVYLIQKHQLAIEHLVVVGDMKSDADFAASLGARYEDGEEFFSKGLFST